MLSFFPTPHLDEWWYSVLCRYHVRSGNIKHQTTTVELFGKSGVAGIGSLFPNGNILKIVQQLPFGDEVLRDFILNNTLFQYYTRFQPMSIKEQMLRKTIRGELIVVTSVRRFSDLSSWQPRFCPKCAETEVEPYWHLPHQIPLMTHCPKHRCVLQQVAISPNELEYKYIPLGGVLAGKRGYGPCITEAEDQPWRVELCQILSDYYSLPLSVSIRPDFNNLAIALANKGYDQLNNKSHHTLVNSKALHTDLVAYFGRDLIEQQIGPPQMHVLLNRLCKWEGQVPERYAILQCFAGIPSEQVFSEQREPDAMFERICAIMETPMPVTKKQVLTELGLTNLQLDNLLKKYNLTPFWRPAAANSIRKPYKLSCSFTEADYQLFEEAFNQSGYRYRSEFIEDIVMGKVKNRD